MSLTFSHIPSIVLKVKKFLNRNKKNTFLKVDLTLTPENAPERGYEYAGEVIYDPEDPQEVMQDIIDAVEKRGYKLGSTVHVLGTNVFTGIYAPLKKK